MIIVVMADEFQESRKRQVSQMLFIGPVLQAKPEQHHTVQTYSKSSLVVHNIIQF